MAKSVLICNSFLFIGYMTFFKTYRNSNLATMHIFATMLGFYNGTSAIGPVFDAYTFNKSKISLDYALEDRDLP